MNNLPAQRGPYYARKRVADYLAELVFFPNQRGYFQSNSQFTYMMQPHEFGRYQYLEFTDRDQAFPGDEVTARMWFMRPEIQIGMLEIGQTFEIILAESRTVGHGRILHIFNRVLEIAR